MYTTGKAEDYLTRSISSTKSKYKNGLYPTADLAAYAFGQRYNAKSIKLNREMGAIIEAVKHNGGKFYTWRHVFMGGKANVLNMWFIAVFKRGINRAFPNKNTNYAATVHTHASCSNTEGKWVGNGTFFFSPNDMKFLPKNKYLIAPDGAMHFAEGAPSEFKNIHPNSTRNQKYYEKNGWWYGQILGYNLPSDPICGSYKP